MLKSELKQLIKQCVLEESKKITGYKKSKKSDTKMKVVKQINENDATPLYLDVRMDYDFAMKLVDLINKSAGKEDSVSTPTPPIKAPSAPTAPTDSGEEETLQ